MTTRRTFLKRSAATAGGTVLVGRVATWQLETLVMAGAPSAAGPVEDVVASACWIGKQDCGIQARRIVGMQRHCLAITIAALWQQRRTRKTRKSERL